MQTYINTFINREVTLDFLINLFTLVVVVVQSKPFNVILCEIQVKRR